VFFQFSDNACADRGHPKRDLGVNGDKFLELVSKGRKFIKKTVKKCYKTRNLSQNLSQNVAKKVSKFGEFYPSKIEMICFPHYYCAKICTQKKTALGPRTD